MRVRSLGYLRLISPDLDAWRVFAGDFLGLMPVASPAQGSESASPGSVAAGSVASESIAFRVDHYPARLVVTRGPEAKMESMGFEVLNSRELRGLASRVEAAGITVTTGTKQECADRRVTGFVSFADPGGNNVELFFGPILDHVRVATPLVSSFVTGDMGLGHVIVSAEDAIATLNFYIEVLGFVERNTMRSTWFLGCNPRHHSFGIAKRRGPGKLMHLMLEAATIDDVGLALDRARKLDIPMMNTLGKHTNDHMISFYVYSPENYAVEFGFAGLRVESEQPTYEITEGAFWGHHFTPPRGA